MSAVPASAAGVPLSQTKGAETERAQHQATAAERKGHADAKAESASGVGLTEGDQETSERDADGRRLWEETPGPQNSAVEEETTEPEPQRSKDASGQAGHQLDLMG
jgi:hypothetical protein